MNQYQTSTITSQSTPSARYGLFHEIAMVLSISPTQCKGFCKTIFHTTSFGGKFPTGLKKCSACYVSIMTEESRCPCCNLLLKTGPRNGTSKSNRFYERI
jgi:hypothetical protein